MKREKAYNVVSFGDGISGGQIALEKAGVKVGQYYAIEIDPKAIAVTQNNYPNTIQLGDAKKVDGKKLKNIDILIGGPPCQDFSIAGNRKNFDGENGKLTYEYVRLLKELNPTYFFMENVPMKKEVQDEISELLGVQPIKANSALVSAQNRERLYWTNIPNVSLPEDKGIMFADVLETKGTDCNVNEYYFKGEKRNFDNRANRKYQTNLVGNIYPSKSQAGRIFSTCNSKSPSVSYNACDAQRILEKGKIRKLTPKEYERLQTLPDNYTAGHSDCARYKMIGNGWTVDMVSHFFKNIKPENQYKKVANLQPSKPTNKIGWMAAAAFGALVAFAPRN